MLHTACSASQEHATSDILPGCFALGGCQPQFCTSLQAQFDVVWITFRHTHTPSLAFIQGGNAGRPPCSEGGILARAKYTWQKISVFIQPIMFHAFPSCSPKTAFVSRPKTSFLCELIAVDSLIYAILQEATLAASNGIETPGKKTQVVSNTM